MFFNWHTLHSYGAPNALIKDTNPDVNESVNPELPMLIWDMARQREKSSCFSVNFVSTTAHCCAHCSTNVTVSFGSIQGAASVRASG